MKPFLPLLRNISSVKSELGIYFLNLAPHTSVILYLHVWIRIRIGKTDPDSQISWIRIWIQNTTLLNNDDVKSGRRADLSDCFSQNNSVLDFKKNRNAGFVYYRIAIWRQQGFGAVLFRGGSKYIFPGADSWEASL